MLSPPPLVYIKYMYINRRLKLVGALLHLDGFNILGTAHALYYLPISVDRDKMEINCVVVCSESSEFRCKLTLSINEEYTVKDVKEIIYNQLGIQCSRQQLKFEDQLLENEKQLSGYNIRNESTIQLMIMKGSETNDPQTGEGKKY